MILNQTADYGVRAMAFLSALGPGEAARSTEIARSTGAPAHYLSKVLRRLVLAGLITGQKGHHGGYRLARAPRDVRVADVIRPFLPRAARPDRAGAGPIGPVVLTLDEVFAAWARNRTLADLSPTARATRRRRIAAPRAAWAPAEAGWAGDLRSPTLASARSARWLATQGECDSSCKG